MLYVAVAAFEPSQKGAKDGAPPGWVTPAMIKTQKGGPLAESLSAGIFEGSGDNLDTVRLWGQNACAR